MIWYPPLASCLLPPEALRLAATGRGLRRRRSELLRGVLPAWPPGGPTREGEEGRVLCPLARFYRAATGEGDAVHLLADEARALPPPLRRLVGNEALHLAVTYGHAAVIAWLKTAYGLTAADARFRPCIGLLTLNPFPLLAWGGGVPSPRALCREGCLDDGHLDGALGRLLDLHYDVPPAENVRAAARARALQEGYALGVAARAGDLSAVQALYTTFGLGVRDVLAHYAGGYCIGLYQDSPLGEAVMHGHLEVAQWLWAASGLTPEEFWRRDEEEVPWRFDAMLRGWLFEAAAEGHAATLRWLVATVVAPRFAMEALAQRAPGP